jgi:uncharacterized membrane protein YsdA (DUF1294 family)
MKKNFTIKHFFILLIALALPIFSILHYSLIVNDLKHLIMMVLGFTLVISLVSFFCCKKDKQKAINGEWRIPEANLHFLELIGGWPGSYMAQRLYRHKVSKVKYQIVFWLIVLVYNYVSVDYLSSWRISKFIIDTGRGLAS